MLSIFIFAVFCPSQAYLLYIQRYMCTGSRGMVYTFPFCHIYQLFTLLGTKGDPLVSRPGSGLAIQGYSYRKKREKRHWAGVVKTSLLCYRVILVTGTGKNNSVYASQNLTESFSLQAIPDFFHPIYPADSIFHQTNRRTVLSLSAISVHG